MKHLYTTVLLFFALTTFLFTSTAFAQSCTPTGNQVSYGTNNQWIGYVYQGMAFENYKGFITAGVPAAPDFDMSFNGSQVNYNTSGCAVYTDTFSVRYKLAKNFTAGNYRITVGADDGYRLSLDGGTTWMINEWHDQGYASRSATVYLDGSYNMVLEFYEHFGGNRVTFALAQLGNPGNEYVYGSNYTWIGHMYQGRSFGTYIGDINEGSPSSSNFNTQFGGSNTSLPTSSGSVTTNDFSGRFMLHTNLAAGNYTFTVGGDDGFRFSIDGGVSWLINEWTDHSYMTRTTSVTLDGAYNFVIEYYENGGDNQLSFDMQYTPAASLPVKLTSFTANTVAADLVQLKWTTAEELAFDHFTLQRSTDGQHFTGIQQIAGQQHNSTITQTYAYTDRVNTSGNIYYRLAMVDKDGSVEYSTIEMVTVAATVQQAKIYPTIVKQGVLFVEADAATPVKIDIYDMNGKHLLSQALSSNGRQQVSLPAGISKGSYISRLTAGQQLITQKIFLIQ